jgi:Tfp pilus assembly PilM family ATPase
VKRPGFSLARWLREPEYPSIAVEVRTGVLGVVRIARERGRWGVAAAAALELPGSALELSMVKPNIVDAEAFGRTLKAVLERAGILGGGPVALVLPDPVARVALLPQAEVKGRRRRDVEEMIRFRLRKAVPFEVKDARVAWVQPRAAGGMVLVGLIHRPVVEAYEEACRAVGLEPGLVELAGLALTSAAEGGLPVADRLIVNWDVDYVSFVLVRGGGPVLIRTLSGPAASDPELVTQEATQTVLYYRDRLGGSSLAGALVRAAAIPEEQALDALREPLGVDPVPLNLWPGLGVEEPLPVAHSLAGAAASLLRRTA